MQPETARSLLPLVEDITQFSRVLLPQTKFRQYQIAPARAVAADVIARGGTHFALVFSRQAGKDEVLAQLLAFLLTRFAKEGGSIVVGAPTLMPQAKQSMNRLESRLRSSALTAGEVRTMDGNRVVVRNAWTTFLSAAPTANVRGETASLLLVANEAQDIRPEIWDAKFDPMAASTNATTLYMGTTWDRIMLLSRQMKHLEALERSDGKKRVYRVPWREVAKELPAYGERVQARIAQLGENHPFIKTEYELIELDGEGGLFPPMRLAQLMGDHNRLRRRRDGARYALLIDVAGEEEAGSGPEAFDAKAKRDSTALTVVELVDVGGGQKPSYRVVDRAAWTGVRHTRLHAQFLDLVRNVWKAIAVVVDATGVGAGLYSFLSESLVRDHVLVHPFIFSSASKSQLGWDYIGLIDTGRVKEYVKSTDTETEQFWYQAAETTYELLPGPGKLMRWGVPESRGHDDLIVSAALTAVLDQLDLRDRRARGSAIDSA